MFAHHEVVTKKVIVSNETVQHCNVLRVIGVQIHHKGWHTADILYIFLDEEAVTDVTLRIAGATTRILLCDNHLSGCKLPPEEAS